MPPDDRPGSASPRPGEGAAAIKLCVMRRPGEPGIAAVPVEGQRFSQRIGATRSHEVSLHGEIQQPPESQNSEDGEREDKDATGE